MKIRKYATIALLVLTSFAANGVAPSKTELEGMYDKAFREFDANNYAQALKDLDVIDARQPELAESQNLRGVILMRQQDYQNAETALRKALAADPKFWNARFNLAEIPFLQKNWAEARKRFQELLNGNASELQGEATQLIQYKILLTYLLEGKENMVDSMLAKFELAPDTPAVHYTNAAIALNKKEEKEAKDWLTNAEKSFSPQLNKLFAESLYTIGWLEKPVGQTRAAIELNSAADRAAKTKEFADAKFEEAEQAFQQRDFTAARKLVDEAKIYSPALNGGFSESFFDLGWLQSPAMAASPAPMVAEASQPESAPAIEPTPIPAITLAQTDKARPTDPLSIAGNSAVSGMEAMTSTAEQSPPASTAAVTTPDNALPTAALSPSVETPVASTALTAAARPVIASAPEPEQTNEVAATADAPAVGAAASTPATVLAPAQVREWSKPTMMETLDRFGDRNTLLVGSLLAGILLLAWVVIPEIRRRFVNAAATPRMSPATVTGFNGPEASAPIEEFVSPTRLMGGPPQVSLQLRASEPPIGNGAIAPTAEPAPVENRVQPAPVIVPEPVVEDEGMGEPVALQENGTSFAAAIIEAPSAQAEEFVGEPVATADSFVAEPPAAQFEAPMAPFVEAPAAPELETETETAPAHFEDIVGAPAMTDSPVAADHVEAPFAPQSEPAAEFVAESVAPEMQVDFAPAAFQQPEPIDEQPVVEEPVFEQPIAQEEAVLPAEAPATFEMPAEITPVAAEATAPEIEALEEPSEAIGQGQPIPYQTAPTFNESHASEAPAPPIEAPREQRRASGFIGAVLAGIGVLRHSVANPPLAQEVESPVPATQQRTTPAIMAQPTQPTPAPVIRNPQPQPQPAQMGGAPQQQPAAGMQQPAAQPVGATQQPAGGMHTAVQLTFSFELASLQLTPNFKMGALQLKPTSKIVTMRLAPSQHPQPAMNLQVTFEVSSVQLNGTSIGMVRLTPSQQQRPGITNTPSFNIAGLQLVSGADAAPVQLTPAQQGQASVLVTAPFQIATVEFSPSLEITSIILNASSRNVNVQLPGTGPSAVEGAPVFEIANVQLSGNGDIGMMQLNAPGGAAKRA
ncbi:MAG: tetratricopeptide repeat protein [Chthoniobacterales bacterium]|nr:tetratricopeptide repeat protein [Chthoniobacterales bacterium]